MRWGSRSGYALKTTRIQVYTLSRRIATSADFLDSGRCLIARAGRIGSKCVDGADSAIDTDLYTSRVDFNGNNAFCNFVSHVSPE